ncbi:MAG: acyl-CoA dehydrogenase family protein [Desulfobacteraceae bacterium]|nr:acyl-CoA dehydrogenase family protein [Desulfobacteraceae bacterium]
MDVMLSEQDRNFRDFCRDFAKQKLAAAAEKYGETDDVPRDMVKDMADAGLFKLYVPESLGGSRFSSLRVCLAREEMAGIYCPADVTMAMQGLGSYPILLAGSRKQKEKYLPKIGDGTLLTTYALTEPEAGSDVNGMKTRAEKTSDGYVLNGTKRFISNGYSADMMVVFAKTPLAENERAISAFIVEKGMKGFEVTNRLKMMAPHDLVELEFDNCPVPEENLLGNPGEGYKIAMDTLDVFRMAVGAAAVGIGKRALDESLDYARRRKQFGRSISDFQTIQLKLAQMATDLDAARALVYRAAILKDRGEKISKQTSMAKLFATEAAYRIADEAVQIHGGIGVMHSSVVERLFREIRAMRIYEGTSEIQKLIIANTLLKESK